MVYRIYVEKKPGFDGEAQGLLHELVDLVGIRNLTGLRLLNRYDVEGIDAVLFQQAVPTVFSEPPVDVTYDKLPDAKTVFAVEYLPGQFDQRADSASECIQLLSQGAADQLYLAVRLAICDMVLPADKRVPLILDDALVTFDDERLHAALDYLLEESQRRQILLFTCQKREMDYLQGKGNVTVTEL